MPKIGKCNCFKSHDEEVCELDYSHHALRDVPGDVFTHERTLESLLLDSNQICDLPVPLFHCHSLRRLKLSDNELQSLPPAIASLIQLHSLDISKNAITSIPDNINGCKQLRLIDASVNPLVRLPDGFTQLLALQELFLNDTFLEYLPGNFGRLSRLRVLELRENRLSGLPKSMCRLTQLQRLDLGQNDLSDLPSVVTSLSSLTELFCDFNKLSSLPAALGQLTRLQHLDLANNRIVQLPEELGRCVQLLHLDVSANLLQRLPESCGNLTSLVTLKAGDNTLTRLPEHLGGMTAAEEVDVSHNVLTAVPASVGLMRRLAHLNLDDNCVTQLPSELGSCRCLRVLSLRRNRLQRLPAELGHLTQLHVLNVCSNRLSHLPCSFSKLHALQALWLSENQNKPLVKLQADRDARHGQKVLTCYMLPQSDPDPTADLVTSVADANDDWRRSGGSSSAQRPRTQTRISFSLEGREPRCPRGSLLRAPTPYPKELKALARHSRHLLQLDGGSRSDGGGVKQEESEDKAGDGAGQKQNGSAVEEKVSSQSDEVNIGEAIKTLEHSKKTDGVSVRPDSQPTPPDLVKDAGGSGVGVVPVSAGRGADPPDESVSSSSVVEYSRLGAATDGAGLAMPKVVPAGSVGFSQGAVKNQVESSRMRPLAELTNQGDASTHVGSATTSLARPLSELTNRSGSSQHGLNSPQMRPALESRGNQSGFSHHVPSPKPRPPSNLTNQRGLLSQSQSSPANDRAGTTTTGSLPRRAPTSMIGSTPANQLPSPYSQHGVAMTTNRLPPPMPRPPAGHATGGTLERPRMGQRPPAPPPYHVAAAGRMVNSAMCPVAGSRGSLCVRMERSSALSNGGVRDARSSLPPDLRTKDASLAWKRVEVSISKSPGLGFSIAGGKSSKSPFMYVSRVNAAGPAHGRLRVGDRLVSVNGTDLSTADHTQAVSTLMHAADTLVHICVLRPHRQ